MSEAEEAKTRGRFLKTVLILGMLCSISYVMFVLPNAGMYRFPAVTIALNVLLLIFCLAAWKWKKWGIVGLVASFPAIGAFNVIVGHSPIHCFLGPLVAAGVAIAAARPKWHLFT
jgi:hypothetical protein